MESEQGLSPQDCSCSVPAAMRLKITLSAQGNMERTHAVQYAP